MPAPTEIPEEVPSKPEDSSAQRGENDALFALVYERLKTMASTRLAGQRSSMLTLDTTEIVHELYLRLNAGADRAFEHPLQFFCYAAKAMRHLLADIVRHRMRVRAGGDLQRVTITFSGIADAAHADSMVNALSIERVLSELETVDARAAQVVELRYFAGLSLEQIAEQLGLTRRTIDRDWQFARAFLKTALETPS